MEVPGEHTAVPPMLPDLSQSHLAYSSASHAPPQTPPPPIIPKQATLHTAVTCDPAGEGTEGTPPDICQGHPFPLGSIWREGQTEELAMFIMTWCRPHPSPFRHLAAGMGLPGQLKI